MQTMLLCFKTDLHFILNLSNFTYELNKRVTIHIKQRHFSWKNKERRNSFSCTKKIPIPQLMRP